MKHMPNILRKARLAITSRWNHKKELSQIQVKRLNVCNNCPFNSDNKQQKTIKDKTFISLNKFLDMLFGIKATEDAVCLECGCNLIHKSSQEDKNDWCGLGKWDNIR